MASENHPITELWIGDTAPATSIGDVLYLNPATGALAITGTAGSSPVAVTGTPTGAAGGDLSGTYPNPTVARVAGVTPGAGGLAVLDDASTTAIRTTLGLGERNTANGYGGLDAGALLPIANIASGTPDGTKFVRDDGTLAVPPGTGVTSVSGTAPIASSGGATPTISLSALGVTDAYVATANKDGTAGTPSMRTLGTGATQAAAGTAPGAAQAAAEATAAAALATHEGAADPHTGYQKESEKDSANGYAGLDANARVVTSKVQFAATNKVLGRSTAGAGAGEEIDATAAGRTLLGAADAAAQRAALDLEPGTDIPSQSAFDDHSARHESGGADAIKIDDLAAGDDNTDLNASTAKHGLMPKLGNNAAQFFDGAGAQKTAPGRIIKVTPLTVTSSSTHTTDSKTTAMEVFMVGGGAGGGGVAGGVGQTAAAGGGASGAFVRFFYASASGSTGYSYQCGAGGAGGTAGNNAGTTGSDTTFDTLTAKGGGGGAGMAGNTTSRFAIGGLATPGSSGGNINAQGAPGGTGCANGTAQSVGGPGGVSAFGGSGNPSNNAAGNNADGPGGGGGGASVQGNTNYAGGNGADGNIIVVEYGNPGGV